MTALLDTLAARARPVILVTAALLAIGAFVTVFGMPLVGWSIYGLGLLGALLAFPAIAGLNRARMSQVAWWTLAILYIGLLLGVAVLVGVVDYYLRSDSGAPALMPLSIVPVGMWAGVIAWIGLILFGWATWLRKVFAKSASVAFAIGGLLGLIGEIGWLPLWSWTLAVLVTAFGLVVLAPASSDERLATSD